MNLRNSLAAAAVAVAAAACSNNDYDGDRPRAPVANAAPIVAAIADVTTNQDTVVGPLEFTVNDDTTPANMLVVTATANGDSPFPADAIVIGGDGTTRNVTLTPLESRTGAADVLVSVTDAQGLVTRRMFRVTVNPRPTSVRDAVVSTFAKQDADEPTMLNGFTFVQDADDPDAFAGLLGQP